MIADVLRDLAAAMRDVGAGWYLFGAQAALLHGAARLTADVDVTVAWQRRDMAPLLAALRSRGFELRPAPADFIERTRVIPLVHRNGIQTDLVLGGPGLEDLFLERAVQRTVEGVRVPVATAEDLIAMK